MILFKNIQGNISDFVIERDYMSMLGDLKPGHDWRFVDTDYFLTDYAKQWFEHRGIILKEKSSLFRADGNSTHAIHSDSFVNDVGINFVLQGVGEMQWVIPTSTDHRIIPDQGVTYPWYGIQPDAKVIGSWSGTMGMVNIKVPHRIKVTSDIPRVCFSLRPNFAICKVNFDMLYDRI